MQVEQNSCHATCNDLLVQVLYDDTLGPPEPGIKTDFWGKCPKLDVKYENLPKIDISYIILLEISIGHYLQ